MPGVHRDGEQRALLPLEYVTLAVLVEPHLRGATALNHEINFLIEVLFRIERACSGHLDHVASPFPLGAVQLDVGALAAEPLPRRQRKILHLAHANIAKDRDPFRFHEQIIWSLRPAELAEAGTIVAGRFVPMRPPGQFVHAGACDGREDWRNCLSLKDLLLGGRQGK